MLAFRPLCVLSALLMVPCGDDTPERAADSGVVEGRIVVDGGGRLPTVVVYLESTDPGREYAAPSERPKIRQKGAKFAPSLLVICVGQTVDFPNDEDRPIQHNVFSKSVAHSFDLGLYRPGKSKSVKFDEPGAVRLHCSIHKHMDGVIYVCPTPFFARVADDGRFRIESIPDGEYELRTWQQKRRYLDRSVRVKVAAERPTKVKLELRRN